MRFISIDPSIVEIGIAIFQDRKFISSYTFRTKSIDSETKRISQIAKHFRELEGAFDFVVIERAGKFIRQGKNGGMTNVNAVQMLMMATGAIVSALSDRYDVIFVDANRWKKTTGKKSTQMIATEISGQKLNSHESDAMVMGYNWLKDKIFRGNMI